MALSASGSGASRSVVYRLIADATGVLAGTRQASLAMKKFGNDVTAVTKEGERTRKGLDEIGRTAGRVGLIAAAGLGLMVVKAANFDQAMSNVAAATHESEINMGRLRDAVIEAGGRTQFSATEAADAVTELGKAGVSTADILGKNGALNGSLALAAAGQLDVAEAAEITATALSQFKLPGSQAAHVADLLSAGANKAQGEVTDMANALKFAGVPASNLGVSIEETAGTIALLAKNGILGEQAGTSLRGMLSSLTSPSRIAREELDNLGITLFDSEGKFTGLAGVADQLQTQMGGLTDQERANALGRIFGNEQLQAANVLYREGGNAVRTWTREVNDTGNAAETAAIKTDNLRGDLERLKGALDTALISGGEGSQGGLRGLTKTLTGVVDAYNSLPGAAKGAANSLLLAGVIAGGTIWAGSKLVRTVSATREAMENLGPAGTKAARGMGRIGLTAGGVFAAAQAMGALYNATTDLGNAVSAQDIPRDLEAIGGGRTTESLNRLAGALEGVNEAGAGTVNALFAIPSALTGIETSFRTNTDTIEAFDQQLASLVESGNAEAAVSAFAAIRAAAAANGGVSDSDVVRQFDAYALALGNASDAADETTESTDAVASSTRNLANTMGFTASEVQKAREAYKQAGDAARGIGEEFFGVGQKVDKAKVSLGEWLRDLEQQADALTQFTANAKTAADRGLTKGLIKALEEAGPAGALRMKQLANATDGEIDRANKAWKRGQDAIGRYVKATTKIPNPLRIDADTHPANTALDALIRRIGQLRSVQMDVRLGSPTFATGGPVVGPGSGTSDSIPAYLSNGEYVIKAAAVARYGTAMFDRLNAMHFATGGFVGGGGGASAAEIAAALAGQRTLANTMIIQPHNYNEFLRQDAQMQRAASSDGWRKR